MSGSPRQFEHALRAATAPGWRGDAGPRYQVRRAAGPVPFWRGGTLSEGRVAYETWGELNEARDNAILLFTGLSPSAHAASSAKDPAPAGGKRWSVPARPSTPIATS
jgi:homoserine O-acetyltransferase